MRESTEAKRRRARKIVAALKKAYPDAKIALNFSTPLELIVATILAAQCTDERVNMVTPALFRKYRTAPDWATADLATLDGEIHAQLVLVLPKKEWTLATHLLTTHGRRTCSARAPLCPGCPVKALCPWPDKTRVPTAKR